MNNLGSSARRELCSSATPPHPLEPLYLQIPTLGGVREHIYITACKSGFSRGEKSEESLDKCLTILRLYLLEKM
jgi:hypothetical protein